MRRVRRFPLRDSLVAEATLPAFSIRYLGRIRDCIRTSSFHPRIDKLIAWAWATGHTRFVALDFHHIWTLLKSQYKEYETKSSLDDAPLRGLPPELLDLVVFYVRDERDLVSICKSARALYQSARVALYKSINTRLEGNWSSGHPGVTTLNFARHAMLYQTLRRSEVAHLVTDFRICIASKHIVERECSCDSFDSMLGEALLALENIEVMYFQCHCCERREGQRHQYLETLKTQKIQQLSFYCTCSRDKAEQTRRLLTAPCFQNVTSLALGSLYGRHLECADLAAKETLPKLKKLMCSNITPMLGSLFAKETVTHFVCDFAIHTSSSDLLHSIVEKHPGVLHHLVMTNEMDSNPYLAFRDPTPYSNLRHFGKFIFQLDTLSPEEFNKSISSLAALPKLSSFEVRIDQNSERMYDNEVCDCMKDPTVLSIITNSLPVLKRIYFTINPHRTAETLDFVFWVWNLREGQWIGDVVAKLDSWDIMVG